MAYGLPTRGQSDWDDELNNSLDAIKATADGADTKASTALSTANAAASGLTTTNGRVTILEGRTTGVSTVNGQSGAVTLGATSVGAATPADIAAASITDRDRANHTGTQTSATISDLGSATVTFSNKRITKRVTSATSVATLTISSDAVDMQTLTAQAVNLTIAAPTGTPTIGQTLLIRVKDDGTSRTLTWDTAFRGIGVTLPVSTVGGKTLYVGAMWNSTDSKWDVTAVSQEA